MWEAFINVFVDDVGLIQDEVTLDQDWNLAVGVHHIDVFGFVVKVNITDFKVHAFFEQHEAATM
jgi:hypothetical protein